MRGCVMKRGKTYTVIVYLGRDPETGKKRRKWHGGYRTKKEAERACAELVRDLGRGSYVEPNPITVGEYLTKWLANHRQNLKPSTVPSYEIAVEKHLIPRIGAMPLQKLAPHHLDTMYGELRTNGHRQRPGGLSARSVRAIHGVMRRALNQAVKAGLLETNPALRATPPQAKSARTDARQSRRFLTLEETRRFLGSVREHGLRAAFQLSVTTGMRRGEVMGLRWRDVDLDNGRLSIEQTLLAPRYQLTVSGPKSEDGWRTVDLDEGTVAVLRAHRKRQAEERLAFGPGYERAALLFPDPVFRNEDGTHLHPALYSLALASAAKAAGLGTVKLKDLRNSHVALLGEAGEHPQVVSERVGHSDPGFTLREYGKAFAQQHRQAADRVGQLLAADGSAPTGGSSGT